ncbi:MAG: potassium channel family protein, partial [Planctomycetota bacterium]
IHAGSTTAAFQWLRAHRDRFELAKLGPRKAVLLSGLVLVFLAATLLEAALWAGAYLAVGAIEAFEPALYFSIVTFTTLGYGDLTLDDPWRLLASFEAAVGIVMFGWTTAVIVTSVQKLYGAMMMRGEP